MAVASVHNFNAQFVPETNLHFPSFPFINGHVVSFPTSSAQVPKDATHPAPVVTQPAANAVQDAGVV